MSEFDRAREWRERMNFSRTDLSKLTGFSVSRF